MSALDAAVLAAIYDWSYGRFRCILACSTSLNSGEQGHAQRIGLRVSPVPIALVRLLTFARNCDASGEVVNAALARGRTRRFIRFAQMPNDEQFDSDLGLLNAEGSIIGRDHQSPGRRWEWRFHDGAHVALVELREPAGWTHHYQVFSRLVERQVISAARGEIKVRGPDGWREGVPVSDLLVNSRRVELTAAGVKEADPNRCAHSSDFVSAIWFGATFQFAKGQQARIVQLLWREWQRGGLSLSSEAIADALEISSNFDVPKAFYRVKDGKKVWHAAWGTMIQSPSKGIYRLAPPAEKSF